MPTRSQSNAVDNTKHESCEFSMNTSSNGGEAVFVDNHLTLEGTYSQDARWCYFVFK